MVAPAEAFHWYVIEVPSALLPLAGDNRIGAAGALEAEPAAVAVDAGAIKLTMEAMMASTSAIVTAFFLYSLITSSPY
jgi:hypothetical protein